VAAHDCAAAHGRVVGLCGGVGKGDGAGQGGGTGAASGRRWPKSSVGAVARALCWCGLCHWYVLNPSGPSGQPASPFAFFRSPAMSKRPWS
jgi:hypothetical protein